MAMWALTSSIKATILAYCDNDFVAHASVLESSAGVRWVQLFPPNLEKWRESSHLHPLPLPLTIETTMRSKARVCISALSVGTTALDGCFVFAFSSSSSLLVPRITLEDYLASPVHKTPVLIRDIVSPESIESLADTLMHSLGMETVSMQRKIKKESACTRSKATTKIYDIALQDCIDYMMNSCHDDAYFTFCEGLLPMMNALHDDRSKLRDKLRNIREAPFSYQENWFEYFPRSVQPTDAIILAGIGATSTLHRDPFEWTGTSLCLEGTKIWRFIMPPLNSSESIESGVDIVDKALESYRLNSIAWDEEKEEDDTREQNHDITPLILSAGWQSDMTLYDSIDEFPSGIELMKLEEEDMDTFQRELEDAVIDMSRLRPSDDTLNAFDQIAKSYDTSDRTSPFITAIQRQGDLLIIPAHYWHQTYAPVPSIAVASQRCGSIIDGANVVKHVLSVVNRDEKIEIPDLLKLNYYSEGIGRDVVATLIEYVASSR
jgi:hypothetical protein